MVWTGFALAGAGVSVSASEAKIKDRYDSQTSPYYAASRLWVDAVINPVDTRKWISMGIEMADHSPIKKKFNVGIIQT